MRRTRYRSAYRDGSYGFPQIAFIDQINQSINQPTLPIPQPHKQTNKQANQLFYLLYIR
jgi:hypothetical protein